MDGILKLVANAKILPSPSFFGPIEEFDCHPLLAWVRENKYVTPTLACIFYLSSIFVILPLIRWRKKEDVPAWMTTAFAFWNLFLSVFSTAGFTTCAAYLVVVLQEKGLHYVVCSDSMMLGTREEGASCYGPVGYMMSIFMLSKFPELLDTFFLVAMHKQIQFIHWYHHVTVLMYSWFAYNSATPSAVLFGTMNFFVHSIMYFYFFASQYTRHLGFMRKPITMLQLLQMIVGVSMTAVAYFYQSDPEVGCSATYSNSGFFIFCICLYGSYLILFFKLYLDNYVFKKKHQHGRHHHAKAE